MVSGAVRVTVGFTVVVMVNMFTIIEDKIL